MQDEKDEKASLQNAFNTQKDFLNQRDEENSKVLAQYETDKATLAEVKKSLEETKQAKKELNEKFLALESEKNKIALNVRLEKDMIRNELNEEIEKLKTEIEKLNEEIGDLKENMGSLNAEIKIREDDLDRVRGDNDRMKEDIDRIEGVNEDLNQEIKNLIEKLDLMKNE